MEGLRRVILGECIQTALGRRTPRGTGWIECASFFGVEKDVSINRAGHGITWTRFISPEYGFLPQYMGTDRVVINLHGTWKV